MSGIDILYKTPQIIVCVKPPGIPSQGDKAGTESMIDVLSAEFGQIYPIHRLDRGTGGTMVFARTKEAAAHLSKQAQAGTLRKTYIAVVSGKAANHAELANYLIKNQKTNHSRVVDKDRKGAKLAELEYQLLGTGMDSENKPLSLVSVLLKTGRHHQIRVQMANAGLPVCQDSKYNPAFKKKTGSIPALWAMTLEFEEPKTGKKLSFSSKPNGNEYPYSIFKGAI